VREDFAEGRSISRHRAGTLLAETEAMS